MPTPLHTHTLYRASHITHRGDMIKEITYIMDIGLQNVLLGLPWKCVLQESILESQVIEKYRFCLLNLKNIIYDILTFTMCVFLFHVFLLHIFIIYFLYIYLYSSNAQIAKLTTRASEKKISHLWNIYSNEKDKKNQKRIIITMINSQGKVTEKHICGHLIQAIVFKQSFIVDIKFELRLEQ